MSGAFTGDGFAGFSGGRDGWPGSAIWDGLEQLRVQFFDRSSGVREARRDVRGSLLALLAEKPMTGSQLIAEVELRSDGAWTPSPGTVYPTLQLLVDEGLLTAAEVDGRKTYTLTDEGRAVAEASAEHPAPWAAQHAGAGGRSALPKAGLELAQAAALVGRSGTPEQIDQAVAALDEARRRLFSILAQD